MNSAYNSETGHENNDNFFGVENKIGTTAYRSKKNIRNIKHLIQSVPKVTPLFDALYLENSIATKELYLD